MIILWSININLQNTIYRRLIQKYYAEFRRVQPEKYLLVREKIGRGARKLSVFFFKLNIENNQLFEQKNFKSKLENQILTFIFVIFDILENNLGKIKK